MVACGGDSDTGTPAPLDSGVPGADGGTPPSAGEPLYAVESMLFDLAANSRKTYLTLLPSIDTQETVKLQTAREFPEYSPSEPFGGAIIVTNGERPELNRYTISASNQWSEPETISFAQYTSAALEAAVYATPEKAYVPFDKTNHVLWNPTTFTVVKEVGASPAIPLTRDGMNVFRGNNWTVAGTRFFQPYYWSDTSYTIYSKTSQINVIDTVTDEVKTPIDVPCPHLHLISQDDDGNAYFSNGQGSIANAVLNPTAPRNCFVRVNAGTETIDPSNVVEFRTLAEGREGSNLFYIGNGRALFNVYHQERDPPGATAQVIAYSPNYHIWTVDLATRKAAIMEGIDFGGGQFLTFRIDRRVFVAMPKGDYSSTAVYEVNAEGKAEKRFDVEGWAMKIYRIR